MLVTMATTTTDSHKTGQKQTPLIAFVSEKFTAAMSCNNSNDYAKVGNKNHCKNCNAGNM